MQEGLLIKYRPQRLQDLTVYQKQIGREITTFLNKFANPSPQFCPNLLIMGKNGIGKSLIVDLTLQSLGYEKEIFRSEQIIKEKIKIKDEEAIETYYRNLTNSFVLQLSGHMSTRKIVMVIDDASNIYNSNEKKNIKLLMKHNNKHLKLPIIVISDYKHNKLIKNIEKVTVSPVRAKKGEKKVIKIPNIIHMFPLNREQTQSILRRIVKAENIQLDPYWHVETLDVESRIIEHAQNDICRLINLLSELQCVFQHQKITHQHLTQYFTSSTQKDCILGIYEATGILLNHYDTIDYALQVYGDERASIPMIFHENYPMNIENQYKSMPKKQKLDLLYNISKSISESDRVDGLIYSQQVWTLQSVHGFYACGLPSFLINQNESKLHNEEKYNYTRDFNRISIKKNNAMSIARAHSIPYLKNSCVRDFMYMISVLRHYIETEQYRNLLRMIKPYAFTVKDLDTFLKIDKMTKKSLTANQKTMLKHYLLEK